MIVSLAAEAERELAAAANYYALHANVELAETFLREVARSASLLAAHPGLGTTWRGETRRLPMRRFPYSVVYVARGDEIRILAIAHQRRLPDYWRGRG